MQEFELKLATAQSHIPIYFSALVTHSGKKILIIDRKPSDSTARGEPSIDIETSLSNDQLMRAAFHFIGTLDEHLARGLLPFYEAYRVMAQAYGQDVMEAFNREAKKHALGQGFATFDKRAAWARAELAVELDAASGPATSSRKQGSL